MFQKKSLIEKEYTADQSALTKLKYRFHHQRLRLPVEIEAGSEEPGSGEATISDAENDPHWCWLGLAFPFRARWNVKERRGEERRMRRG